MLSFFYYLWCMGTSTVYYNRMRKLAKGGNAKAKAVIKKKKAKDAEVNRKPEQVKKRVESNGKVAQYKKKNGHKPSSKGLDYDHKANSFILASLNRGRRGEGGRKKKNYG